MAAKRNGKREPIAVQGAFVRSVTVGCMVVIETTRQVYITHRDWIPALDAITAARVRAAWAQGALTLGELAAMAGVEHSTIDKCIRGVDNFSHLPPVAKGSDVVSGSSTHAFDDAQWPSFVPHRGVPAGVTHA